MINLHSTLILRGLVHSPSAVVVLDPAFRVVFANESALRIWGYRDPHDVLGKRATGFWNDIEQARNFVAALRDKHAYSGELIARKADGTPADLYVSANAIEDENGNLLGVLGVFFDISIQRDELRRLESGRRVFSLIGEKTKVLVWEAIPEEDHFSLVGDTASLTLPSEEAGNTSLRRRLDMFRPEDRDRLLEAIRAVMEGAEDTRPVEAPAILADGTEKWVENDAYLVSQPGERPARLLGWSRDVTDRKQAEGRALQAQRLQTLGQLAGGVAHDFNNLLMGLQLNLELLQSRAAGDKESEEFVRTSMHTVRRGAELTRYLLAFSSGQALRPEPVDVAATIRGVTDMLRQTLGEAIAISTILPDGVSRAMADQGQLENAVLNLAINARDAMPGGGELVIEVRDVHLAATGAGDGSGAGAGNRVMLSVTDTGVGMAPEISARAFEPFFTTKEAGKGSGLGLSMVYGLVRQLDGHIELESAEGSGTTVRLYFRPAAERSTDEAKAQPAGTLQRGSETVLVVEDDPTVRRSLVKVLGMLGYEVYSAGDGPDALRLIDEFELRPNLVLSDVALPRGMSGPDVVLAVLERVPACRALLMSGYPEGRQDALDKLGKGRVELLNKPYTREVLANKIRDVLADRGPDSASPGRDGTAP